ncbi:cytochrome c oxidase subunit II [Stratiformator vulcanicus]|uniref:Cytochrome c oxidase subunit 2 n=1 Tax=Stratiformator vulcanicus TaxID=2527980 RepID=A0A517R2X1_9PLAN|nr:cytochrome c oxidase subunit II [Stratiformator vulcanicus]QDT38225.1 Cytochrome c oxidase subunit 2 precursor [Stratiformator vulcanicus]
MNFLNQLNPMFGEGGGFWFPRAASTTAYHVDSLFDLILWICIVFFVIIVAVMLYFMIAYRRREGVEAVRTATHNDVLEITWSVIPTLLIFVIFAKGFAGYLDMRTPPENTYIVNVYAKKWGWTFKYPNGVISSNLHVPAGVPVELKMQSEDVIHSFFVPAFRVKQDIVPGRIATTWFEATMTEEDGQMVEYDLFCTEYCGQQHADMKAKAVVHERKSFDCWLVYERQKLLDMPPIDLGKILYEQRGCVGCHSIDGTRKVGPSFNKTFGQEHKFSNADPVVGDEEYVRESIRYPQRKVREGYGGVMPAYPESQLEMLELDALIAYIKSVNEDEQIRDEAFGNNLPPSQQKDEDSEEGEGGDESASDADPLAECEEYLESFKAMGAAPSADGMNASDMPEAETEDGTSGGEESGSTIGSDAAPDA